MRKGSRSLVAVLGVIGACAKGTLPDDFALDLGVSGGDGSAGAAATGAAGQGDAAAATAGSGGIPGAGSGGSQGGSAGGPTGGAAGASGGVAADGGARGDAGNGGDSGEPPTTGTGTITYERWEGVLGSTVADVPVSQAPTFTQQLTSFEAPHDIMNNYGARIHGLLTAPLTGNYTFWIAGDNSNVLRLSTTESATDKVDIVSVAAFTALREWNKFPSQKSAPIPLVAGQRYYVEGLVKEEVGGDNLSVGWLKPGEAGTVPSEVIPGTQLSPSP